MAGRCGGCNRTWSSNQDCHCAECHEHFTSLQAFDMHFPRFPGGCVHPSTATPLDDPERKRFLRQRDDGAWASVRRDDMADLPSHTGAG